MTESSDSQDVISPQNAAPNYSLWQMVQYALKLGSIGFGGPIALVGYMHRDLVEDRKWISESEYSEGMTLAQVAPGPLAAQLAIYLGYVHYGLLGASLVGIAFVLPSFFMVVALGWAYMRYGGLSWMQAVFYGVGACVIGIIALSAYKLTVKIVKGPLLWSIFVVTTAVTVIRETEEVLVILGAGILVWLVKAPPKNWFSRFTRMSINLSPLILLAQTGVPAGDPNLLLSIFLFFAQAGSFVFGSGLAIVPFLYGGVVKNYHWLTDKQFVDAVAVAMITPGPVVITVGFVGYLVAELAGKPGLAGATVAALATFLPCYLITVLAAPYFKKHGKQPGIAEFVNGVTVAATGAIAGAVIVLGRKSILDIPTALIALVTLGLLWHFKKKLPEPIVVLAAALIGLVIYPLTHAHSG
jgi:chromate transporter